MKQIRIMALFVLLAGCKESYDFPLKKTDLSVLVVEGVLNAGQGPTTITLSRSMPVNDQVNVNPVGAAVIRVEGKNGENFTLKESGFGNYVHPQLPLVIGQDYRLRIRLGNKEYLSEYVTAKKSPDLESISWKRNTDGLILYANTHDPANNSKYYKWEYKETWEIRSFYSANFRLLPGTTTIVPASAHHSVCWRSDSSTTILIGSTAHLQSDVVSEARMLLIPTFSDKLSVRYSILVRQHVLSKEAYEFYRLMKSNTESIGTIFDPQPVELPGNIKCLSNPDERVVGFLTASTISEKRIFITRSEASWQYPQYCPPEKIRNHRDSIAAVVPALLPFDAEMLGPTITHYLMSYDYCVDCTTRGGTLTRPLFW